MVSVLLSGSPVSICGRISWSARKFYSGVVIMIVLVLLAVAQQPPSAVGNDYFCESGAPGRYNKNTFYSNDRLWDGEQCKRMLWSSWSTMVLPSLDYELRLCCDEGTAVFL